MGTVKMPHGVRGLQIDFFQFEDRDLAKKYSDNKRREKKKAQLRKYTKLPTRNEALSCAQNLHPRSFKRVLQKFKFIPIFKPYFFVSKSAEQGAFLFWKESGFSTRQCRSSDHLRHCLRDLSEPRPRDAEIEVTKLKTTKTSKKIYHF